MSFTIIYALLNLLVMAGVFVGTYLAKGLKLALAATAGVFLLLLVLLFVILDIALNAM